MYLLTQINYDQRTILQKDFVVPMKIEGIGFGKAILFNEHFVVYGVPAIVSAIGKYTVAKATPYEKPELNLEDNRQATPRYKEDKKDQTGEQGDQVDQFSPGYGPDQAHDRAGQQQQ